MNQDSQSSFPLSRRRFTSKLGVACAAVGVAPGLLYAGVEDEPSASQSGLERAAAMLNVLARDTLAGASSFAVPGYDLYSIVQGVATIAPGGIAAKNDAFLVYMFDNYLPLPVPLGTLANAGWPLEAIVLPLPDGHKVTLADLLGEALGTLDSVPLSLVVMMVLNALALVVNPKSASGPFLSPFARLKWEDKAKVFQLLEDPTDEMLDLIRAVLPRTPVQTVVAYVQLIAVGLLVFSAFGSYSEWAALDPKTRTLKSRPVGWSLSEYQPFGPVEGWDEFRGYYQGRRSALDA